jgi:hypothetical protein
MMLHSRKGRCFTFQRWFGSYHLSVFAVYKRGYMGNPHLIATFSKAEGWKSRRLFHFHINAR